MFRGVDELKGLIIDIDCFGNFDQNVWTLVISKYSCLFMTSRKEMQERIASIFSEGDVCLIDLYPFALAPNRSTHFSALRKLELNTSEVAYVSKRHTFLVNALSFTSGVIWLHEGISEYKEVTYCPDIFCQSLDSLAHSDFHRFGIFGDLVLTPTVKSLSPGNERKALMLQTWLPSEDKFPLFIMGRYFGNDHYMNQLQTFSSAILLNKMKDSKAHGIFDSYFGNMYNACIKVLMENYEISSITRVPPRPNEDDRLLSITERVANNLEINDFSRQLVCKQYYPSQKNLSSADRKENVRGKFSFSGTLSEETIVLIDDVVSTGSTLIECSRVLQNAGAKVITLALAVNQFGNYWSSDLPKVGCPACDAKMKLQVNSRNKTFFFSCTSCYWNGRDQQAYTYTEGRRKWIQKVNQEKEYYHDDLADDKI